MPSIVPGTEAGEWPQYFVLCDYGGNVGRSWYEMDPANADRETILNWLMEGQFSNPVKIVEVHLPAGTCRDVSEDFARIVRFKSGRHVAPETQRFVESAA